VFALIVVGQREKALLRITVHDTPDQLGLKLEGKLAGVWVAELEDCWRAAAATLRGRALQVDLTGVEGVDAAGKYLLALMDRAGAHFIASGCLMSHLIREITGDWPVRSASKAGR
jgi:ABC-type transporter Mla MlaB component